jgi:hypothetical protein
LDRLDICSGCSPFIVSVSSSPILEIFQTFSLRRYIINSLGDVAVSVAIAFRAFPGTYMISAFPSTLVRTIGLLETSGLDAFVFEVKLT